MKPVLWRSVASTLILLCLALIGQAAEQTLPRASLDISGHPFTGPADAPVTLVAFSDYL